MLNTCILIFRLLVQHPPNDLVSCSLLAAIPLVISHEGASGVYPGCTDLAYKQAISDGADVLDCPVQMTKDGTPFCLGSINLIDGTTAAQTFSNLITNIPELEENGIFSFSLDWSDIQSLKRKLNIVHTSYTYAGMLVI